MSYPREDQQGLVEAHSTALEAAYKVACVTIAAKGITTAEAVLRPMAAHSPWALVGIDAAIAEAKAELGRKDRSSSLDTREKSEHR